MKIELTKGQVRLLNNMINIELKNLGSSVYFKPELAKLKLALTSDQKEQYCDCKDSPMRLEMSLTRCAKCNKIVEN